MGLGTPTYVIVTSTGGANNQSPAQLVDDFRNPVNISFQLVGISTNAIQGSAGIQVTLDDPTGQPANPLSSPFQGNGYVSSNPFVTWFGSSLIPGSSTFGQSSNQIGSILIPIRAWRVNLISCNGGSVLVTSIQAGPR